MNEPKNSKIKISFIEPKLIFNTDRNGNQVTVCKLRGVIRYGDGKSLDLDYVANAPLMPAKYKNLGYCNDWVYSHSPQRFIVETVGTATCSSNDTYDKNIGIEIARAKAEQKAYDAALTIVWRDFLAKYDDVMELQDAVNDFHARAIKAIRHNRNYLYEKAEVAYPNDWLDYEEASNQIMNHCICPYVEVKPEWQDMDDIAEGVLGTADTVLPSKEGNEE